jgi:hypothetical protein
MGKHEAKNRKRARGLLNRAGYKAGGHVHADAAQDRVLIRKEIARAEAKEPEGKKAAGKVGGAMSVARLDRPSRFKAGGRVHKGGKGKHVTNITIGAPGAPGAAGPGPGAPDPAVAFKAGLMKGAQLGAAQGGGGKPPMMPPPGAGPGGPPPGGPPMMPPPGGPQPPMQRGGRIARKSGGRIHKAEGGELTAKMPGGAGNGLGRLTKAEYYKGKGKS